MKVGYQGIKGAYSEVAIYMHFGHNVDAVSFETFEDVFQAVKDNKVNFGMIPVENTINGSVAENFDLLLKEDVYVITEVFLQIKHCLLSHKGNQIKNIKMAYSHPVALNQCREFLRNSKIKPVSAYDTAGAAKMVSEKKDVEEAAIASELCADIYNLAILVKNIESNKNNTTKFFIIVKRENIPEDTVKEKTSIVFKTKHVPGALVNTLQRLAKNDVNLTKLESRPIPDSPWEYVFFADFEGGIDDDNVKLSLNEMEASSIFVKVLGSYPKGKAN